MFSIDSAVLSAIYQACKYMDTKYNNLKPRYVKILTDSQSALQALNNIDFKLNIALKTVESMANQKMHNSLGKSPYRHRRQ